MQAAPQGLPVNTLASACIARTRQELPLNALCPAKMQSVGVGENLRMLLCHAQILTICRAFLALTEDVVSRCQASSHYFAWVQIQCMLMTMCNHAPELQIKRMMTVLVHAPEAAALPTYTPYGPGLQICQHFKM